jgi:prefoldin subunit 5
VLRSTADAVAQAQARYSRSEIRMIRHVDVAALRAEIDALAKERRELDTAIQGLNWTAELSE